IADVVDVRELDARVLEAPVDRVIRELPCGERHGTLAVLDAGEALLLRRGDHVPVLDETGGRIVISGVDAERIHPFPGSASLRTLRAATLRAPRFPSSTNGEVQVSCHGGKTVLRCISAPQTINGMEPIAPQGLPKKGV